MSATYYRQVSERGEEVILVEGEGWWAVAAPGSAREDLRAAGRIPALKFEHAIRITHAEAEGFLGRKPPGPPAVRVRENAGPSMLEPWVGRQPVLGLVLGVVLYIVLGALGLWITDNAFGSSTFAEFVGLFAAIFLGSFAGVSIAGLESSFMRGALFGGVYGIVLMALSLVLRLFLATSGSLEWSQLLGFPLLIAISAVAGGLASCARRPLFRRGWFRRSE